MRGSLNICHGENDVEARQRASGGDGCAAHSCDVLAIGMRDFLDQSRHTNPIELSRPCTRGDVQVRKQIGVTPAVASKLALLQGSQQGLLDGIEESQFLDAGIVTEARLTQSSQIALPRAEAVLAGQETPGSAGCSPAKSRASRSNCTWSSSAVQVSTAMTNKI